MRLRPCVFLMANLLVAGSIVTPSYAAEAVPDHFRYMALQKQLNEKPGGPEAAPALFGIGEYFFALRQPQAAASYFERIKSPSPDDPMELLAMVYLLLCARQTGDERAAGAYEESLRRTLSSKHFLAIFHSSRSRAWDSPMQNRYDLREEVDRLEIRLNGKAFHTIELS